MRFPFVAALSLAAAAPAVCAAQAAAPRAVFRVTLPADSSLTHGAPVSGRLIVFMTATRPRDATARLAPGLDPKEVWVAAREVAGLAPGASVDIDADSLAFPRPFSASPNGRRWVMALLDVDHNANWRPFTPGDLVSAVDSLDAVGNRAAPTRLALNARIPEPPVPSAPGMEVVEFTSPRLSAFWKRPVVLRMAVALAPDSEATHTPAGPRFRAVYHIPGWSGGYRQGFTRGRDQIRYMRQGGERGTVHVFLDPQFPTGHPVFANSANNGPWADALTRELIPYLERRYRLIPEARARFLTGHSSGGWATLWLQVSNPDFFGGTWSTSPDPVDFADFTGIDMRPGSRDNLYRAAGGTPHPFLRMEGRDLATVEDFTRLELVMGPGGQMQSFEAVFSPRGADGHPLHAFNRQTGALNQSVLRAWAAYDIRALLQRRWAELGPKLRGKLHVMVGGADTFHLDGPTRRLCGYLRGAGSDATCEIVPGRDHFDLYGAYPAAYPNGLDYRFGQEMQRTFDASR
ncbi:MAG TPA: alpha/beta hydrolase-fold protein [Longimicrobium sp.]|nr:alpha/beta hydrolase-fold protein [Longimicrobium sp.]